MTNIIVAFPKAETGKNIKNILIRSGFHVTGVCTNGAMTLSEAYTLQYGVVVCAYRFADMNCLQLREDLPGGFAMLTIASGSQREILEGQDLICLNPPLRVHELVSTLEMLTRRTEGIRRKRKNEPKLRKEEEKRIINQAKTILMERHQMSEQEAHRYLQKISMDSGRSMYESATMLIDSMDSNY